MKKILSLALIAILAVVSCQKEPKVVNVTAVTLNTTSLEMTEGDSQSLTATVSPDNADNKKVLWTSSGASVATVSNGTITAVKPGSATITATSDDGGKTASCTVNVKAKVYPVTGVTLDKTEISLVKGASETLTATIAPDNATNKEVQWTCSDSKVATVDNGKVTAVGGGSATVTVKTSDGGFTAACTVTVTVPLTGISLDKTSLTLEEGESETLTANVSPSDATDKTVSWKSSNTAVATVKDGKVTAVKAGSAKITVTTNDGKKTASCDITVTPKYAYNGYEYVDLGLPSGLMWATCNLGASTPEDFGDYYQWGGLEDVTSTSIYLDWSNCPYHTGSDRDTGWTKYGTAYKKQNLDPEDDVAHVKLGGKWRMPTRDEWDELLKYCSKTWTTLNGISGRKFTSEKNGNSIFLPAVGLRTKDQLSAKGNSGYYWSSSSSETNRYGYSWCLEINWGQSVITGSYRCYGYAVRPVYK